MSDGLSRRGFFTRSVLASTGAALGLASRGATAAPAGETAPGPAGMPTGRIGKLQISRLISGGNVFSGWTHSRDLKYVSTLAKAYNTDEKTMETLGLCEENGVNTIIAGSSGLLQKYWKERGGKIQWIAQVHPQPNDLTSDIKHAIDIGCCAAYVQGAIGDRWFHRLPDHLRDEHPRAKAVLALDGDPLVVGTLDPS